MKKILAVLIAAAVMIAVPGAVGAKSFAADGTSPSDSIQSGDIVILYDNDVHCAVDGYAKAGALKNEMETKTGYVTMVSCGDFIQGGALGTLSKGGSIIDIMNKVGYNVVTLGNHEFDYKVPRLKKLMKSLDTRVVSCNFRYVKDSKKVYNGYTMKKYGSKKVAFVGITTPESITKSTPVYFQNSKGKYVYTFCGGKSGKTLYNRVQRTVNAAKKKGADYVVAVSHLGMKGVTPCYSAKAVISHTHGIDVMLDGHSHETYAEEKYSNSKGKDVLYSQTGTKFANIGELVIAKDGDVSTSLVATSGYTKTSDNVASEIKAQKDKYAAVMNKVIGKTENLLTINEPDSSTRAIRTEETNLGDYCASAYRSVMGSDIALLNGGGIRADIKAGNITYNDMLNVFPFSGTACMISARGSQIKNALEMGASKYPSENGGFLQVAGIKYTIDSSVPSSVKVDANGMFQKVSGPYRVKNIKVYNKKTKKYDALDLRKAYKVAGMSYTLRQSGDGMSMFAGDKVIKDDTMVDVDVLIKYLKDNLKGVIGSGFANLKGSGRITVLPYDNR